MNNFPKRSDSYPSLAFLQVFPVLLNYTPIHSPVIQILNWLRPIFLRNRNLLEFLWFFQAHWNDRATLWHLSSSYCTKMQLNPSPGQLSNWFNSVTPQPSALKMSLASFLMFSSLVTHTCCIVHLHSHKDFILKSISEHGYLWNRRCSQIHI